MPLSTLDEVPALIVIDLQKGLAGAPTVDPFDLVVDRSRRLAVAFRERGDPVVLVTGAGFPPGRTDAQQARKAAGTPPPALASDWTELVDELRPEDDDLRVTKRTWGAFTNSGLMELLTERKVTQVVITGVATSMGVESTARQAHECGLNVVLAVDAVTDVDREAHERGILYVFPKLGETATTEDILTAIAAKRT